MTKFFKISQVWVVAVMSVFLFSCEKSEMDGLMGNAYGETMNDKNTSQIQMNTAANNTQTADTAYIVTFYGTTPNLNTETDVQNLATSIGGAIQFDITFFEDTKGFAAPLTPNQANAFRADSRVEFVEIDGPIYPAGSN